MPVAVSVGRMRSRWLPTSTTLAAGPRPAALRGVTVRAEDAVWVARLKGDVGSLAARETDDREHHGITASMDALQMCVAGRASRPIALACLATTGAATGRVRAPLARVLRPLARREHKAAAAVAAGEGLIRHCALTPWLDKVRAGRSARLLKKGKYRRARRARGDILRQTLPKVAGSRKALLPSVYQNTGPSRRTGSPFMVAGRGPPRPK